MVTARPFRTNPSYYDRTEVWARETEGAALESGDFIAYSTFREFDLSLGQSEDEIRAHYERSTDQKLTYNGLTALAGASHWQFTAYKSEHEVRRDPPRLGRQAGLASVSLGSCHKRHLDLQPNRQSRRTIH